MRGGLVRSQFQETSEALFLTQGFVYAGAAEAEAAFAGDADRFLYSRYGNPTVSTFEERLRLLEGAEAAVRHRVGHVRGVHRDRRPGRSPARASSPRGRCSGPPS